VAVVGLEIVGIQVVFIIVAIIKLITKAERRSKEGQGYVPELALQR